MRGQAIKQTYTTQTNKTNSTKMKLNATIKKPNAMCADSLCILCLAEVLCF